MIIWLKIELDQEDYSRIIKHVHTAMFFGIKRIAPNLRHLILHSVGDNLDFTGDLQDVQKAEVFLEKKIEDGNINRDNLKAILADKNWYIKFICKGVEEQFYEIVIDKKSEFIIDRQFMGETYDSK